MIQFKLVPTVVTSEIDSALLNVIKPGVFSTQDVLDAILGAAPQPPALGGNLVGDFESRLACLGKIDRCDVACGHYGDKSHRWDDEGRYVEHDDHLRHVEFYAVEVARLQAEVDEAVRLGKYAAACGVEAEARRDKVREQLQAEVERLKAITDTSMGVGDGNGQLIVHGDYDSIKAAQRILWERDDLKTRTAALEGLLRDAYASGMFPNAEIAPRIVAALAEGAKS